MPCVLAYIPGACRLPFLVLCPDFQLVLASGRHWPGIKEWEEGRGRVVQRRKEEECRWGYSKGSISFMHPAPSRQAHRGSVFHRTQPLRSSNTSSPICTSCGFLLWLIPGLTHPFLFGCLHSS